MDIISYFWGHRYLCFELSVTSARGFKARWPLDDQYFSHFFYPWTCKHKQVFEFSLNYTKLVNIGLCREEPNKFSKTKLLPLGIEPRTSWSSLLRLPDWPKLTFKAFKKSCSIDSRNDPSSKYEEVHETKFTLEIYCSTHVCLAQSIRYQSRSQEVRGNWARQESVGQEISEVSFVCFMHHFTCWTLFISRINRAWLYKTLNDSHRQPNSDLAQLAEH